MNHHKVHRMLKKMSAEERQEFLLNYCNLARVNLRLTGKKGAPYARVNWKLSAKLFYVVPYDIIKSCFDMIKPKHFISLVVKNRDNATAHGLIMEGKTTRPELLGLLDAAQLENWQVMRSLEKEGYYLFPDGDAL